MTPFWKKKPQREPKKPEHRRQSYREKPSDIQEATAAVHLPSGESVPAEIVDVSGCGTALRISLARDPALKRGDVIEVSVALPKRPPVKTPAEVVFCEQDGDQDLRYGFRYTNIGNLYSQLDEHYARPFNRRHSRRASATLEQRIPIRITWRGFLIDSKINDISEGGMGVVLSREQAVQLRGAKRVAASFQIAPDSEPLEGEVDIVHRDERRADVLMGMRFVFDDPAGFGRHAGTIYAFVNRRDQRLAGWEGTWRSAG
jgi:c-di-GMP-binding flagellar brake protein YcgR